MKEEKASLALAKVDTSSAAAKASVAQSEARLGPPRPASSWPRPARDRFTLRAPFAGRITESLVSDGQYVSKGAVIAELADVSSLRALVPMARAGTVVGSAVTVSVEGQPVPGKVQAHPAAVGGSGRASASSPCR